MSFDPAGKTIDEILDYGAPGLQYWEHFLPLYEEAFGPCRNATLSGLQAAYDEQRGTDLAKLDTTRGEMAKALENAETQWQLEQAVARDLTAAWTGGTGDQALAMLDAQLRRARTDLDATRTAAAALGEVIEPMRQAVLAKANATLGLLPQTSDGTVELTLGGKTPDDIDTLIADQSDPWLTDTFRPDVEHKLDLFTTACATADAAFESHYGAVLFTLNQVVELPYPCPREIVLPPTATVPQSVTAPPAYSSSPGPGSMPFQSSWPAAPQSADRSGAPAQPAWGSGDESRSDLGAPGPATVRPAESSGATPQPGTTAEAPDAETRSQPQSATGSTTDTLPASTGDTSSLGATTSRALTSGLESLTSAVQQGITGALTKLQSLLPTATGQEATTGTGSTGETKGAAEGDPGGETKSETAPEKGSVQTEFDFAGKHFAFEQSPTGELRLTVTDETGRAHTYTLTLDEHGLPVLTESEQSPATPADGAAADSQAPQPNSPAPPSCSEPAPDTGASPHTPDGSGCAPPEAADETPPEAVRPPAESPAPDSAGAAGEQTGIHSGGGMCSPPGKEPPPEAGLDPGPIGGSSVDEHGAPPGDSPGAGPAAGPPAEEGGVPPLPSTDALPLPDYSPRPAEIPEGGVDIPEAVP
ncbi:hypothetical protein [Nocardia inohanensis]|uniref:hypothetical protein n=1 Tax=Nocardia inohanensis TaxID=209246 RepID=UPI0008311758|nr:hypothetical protein [Nocardia inohanensis]